MNSALIRVDRSDRRIYDCAAECGDPYCTEIRVAYGDTKLNSTNTDWFAYNNYEDFRQDLNMYMEFFSQKGSG